MQSLTSRLLDSVNGIMILRGKEERGGGREGGREERKQAVNFNIIGSWGCYPREGYEVSRNVPTHFPNFK